LILSSCIFPENETAEKQIDAMKSKLMDIAECLDKWKAVYKQLYGCQDHGIPAGSEIEIGK